MRAFPVPTNPERRTYEVEFALDFQEFDSSAPPTAREVISVHSPAWLHDTLVARIERDFFEGRPELITRYEVQVQHPTKGWERLLDMDTDALPRNLTARLRPSPQVGRWVGWLP